MATCHNSSADSDLVEEARSLELRLLDPNVRSQPALVAELLHDDFVEFGASGRRWTKTEIVTALSSEGDATTIEALNLDGSSISDNVALVTYRSVRDDRQARRSSVWVREAGRWHVLFHQATPITPSADT